MRKYSNIEWGKATALAGLGAAGGWAVNKYLLGNKSLKSQILSAAIGGLLSGGGSVAYDLVNGNKGFFQRKHDELQDAESNELKNFAENTAGTLALNTGIGVAGTSAARTLSLTSGKLTWPDSLAGIDVEDSSTAGKVTKNYILGMPKKLSQKSWESATDGNKVKAAYDAMFGRAHVNLTPLQLDTVRDITSDSGVQRIVRDIADARTSVSRLEADVNNLSLAAETAPKNSNTSYYNNAYSKASDDLVAARAKLAEKEELLGIVNKFRRQDKGAGVTNRGMLWSMITGRGMSRGKATKRMFSTGNLTNTLRRLVKEGPLKAGGKIGVALSVAPILADAATNIGSWIAGLDD